MRAIKSSPLKTITIILGVLVFLLVLKKANTTSFTVDESFTYLHYPQDSFFKIISFSDWYMNNHILNSLFMKYSEQLFGNSELALRLPNLILLLVYFYFSYKLFRDSNSIVLVATFTLLATNVLLMDLFGLARGYGLSCGFMLMSLYHFMIYVKKGKKRNLLSFHFGSLLAILSHFTLLPFYISLLALSNLVKFLQASPDQSKKYHISNSNKAHVIPFLINAIILYEPVRRAIVYGQFDVAGKSGFYVDTSTNFIRNALNYISISDPVMLILQFIFTAIVLMPCIIFFRNAIKRNADFFRENATLFITNSLLIGILVIIILQNRILGTDLPIGRFSIFIFPLFIIQLGFFIEYLLGGPFKKTSLILFSLLALIGLPNFAINITSSSYNGWEFDSRTRDMLEDLEVYRDNKYDTSENVSLAINWRFESTTNFYRRTQEIDWLLPANRHGISETADYYYIFENEMDQLKISEYEIIKKYKEIKTVLLKRI